MNKVKQKLAALKAMRDTVAPDEQPERENEEQPIRRGHPVLLSCGHFDWSYSPELDECGHCRSRVHAYPSNQVRGIVVALVYESRRLDELAKSRPDDFELAGRANRLRELAERGASVSGALETFDAYPGHLTIREARYEQGEAVEAASEDAGSRAGAERPHPSS